MSSSHDAQPPNRREWSERETVHSPVVPRQEARQGVTGHNVRYVLGFGIAAIMDIANGRAAALGPESGFDLAGVVAGDDRHLGDAGAGEKIDRAAE